MDVLVGESVRLRSVDNSEITITLERKSGQRARLRISAPADVQIRRPEERKTSR